MEKWVKIFKTALQLKEILESLPKTKIVVYTYGAWDLLHPRHIKLLAAARELGDFLIVGVVADEPIRELKGHGRPVQPLADRLFSVGALRFVDAAIPQDKYDPSGQLKELKRVNILTKGDDWENIPGTETITKMGGRLVKLSYSCEYSSSAIISKISGKDVKKFGEPKIL